MNTEEILRGQALNSWALCRCGSFCWAVYTLRFKKIPVRRSGWDVGMYVAWVSHPEVMFDNNDNVWTANVTDVFADDWEGFKGQSRPTF
jgi:hypothetical protein